MPSLPRPSNDTTINWARSHSAAANDPNARQTLRPGLVLRFATESSYVLSHTASLAQHPYSVDAKAMMNLTFPGQRVYGVISWSATENLDNPTQTAQFEALNALPVSQIQSPLQNTLPAQYHSPVVNKHWCTDNSGVGAIPVATSAPVSTRGFSEDSVIYREFADELIVVADATAFPDPRVPDDEADGTWAPTSSTGVGAYYVLIGNEVIRVYNVSGGNTLYIPAGGRGVNGIIEYHNPGDIVYLLGFEPSAGLNAGMGYMSAYEADPYRSLFRPGQCLVSYEGYGDFEQGSLTKENWGVPYQGDGGNRGYEFTGYWFTNSAETSLSDDGVAKMSCSLSSSAYILERQKITPTAIQRLKNDMGNYAQGAFDKFNTTRPPVPKLLGSGRENWDPDSPNAYPLQVKTEYAQNKAFFDHMRDTTMGKECEFCQTEYNGFVSRPNYKLHSDPIREARVVGKHIYRESIVVDKGSHGPFDAGPLRTFGATMIYLAMVSWDLPMYGNSIAGRWSKFPQALWNNMMTMDMGLCWNGQLSFKTASETDTFLWDRQEYHDYRAWLWKDPLSCPFEASYDKQPWFQPLQELADMNRMTFIFNRRGNPVFIPKGGKLRGRRWIEEGNVQQNNGDWILGYGGSVGSYSHNLDTQGVLTLVWVSGTTAFDSEFSITAAGTTVNNDGSLAWHSSKVGNTEALQYTGGVQQIDTINLDNQVLGLDWNTSAAGWSLQLDRTSAGDGMVSISRLPTIPTHKLEKGKPYRADSARGFQRLYNFLRDRFYINAAKDKNGNFIDRLEVNGKYGTDEYYCCREIQRFIQSQGLITYIGGTDGIWTSMESNAMKTWVKTNGDFIKNDIWFYALAGYDWQYYVASVTGLPIPQNKDEETASEDTAWTVDQLALRGSVQNWQRNFLKHAINVGNQVVDESVNKASVRTVTTQIADPRIQIGDVISYIIPGFLTPRDPLGNAQPPFDNATYITQVSRQMDLQQLTYTATYAGYRYRNLGRFMEDMGNFYR